MSADEPLERSDAEGAANVADSAAAADADVIADSNAVDSNAVDSESVDPETADSDTVDSDTVDSDTVDSEATAPKKRPRTSQRRAGALIGVLAALLGFAFAVQVHSNSSQDSLASAREDDLVAIIANQNELAERRREQISDLQGVQQQLQASGNKDGVAQQQAESETQTLGVLLGTVPATGPGVTLTITDPKANLKAEDLLDVIEELRGAGAEAIQFGPVRVGTSTNFTNTSNGIAVDGTAISSPYVVQAIGDSKTIDTALNIPGGVAATARAAGGDATVTERSTLTISAVRVLPSPKYAQASPH